MPDFTLKGAALTNAAKYLRETELPIFSDQYILESSPFMEAMKKVNLTSPKPSADALLGMSGGFGFGAEDNFIPNAGHLPYGKFVLSPKAMFGTIEITDKINRLGTGGTYLRDHLHRELLGVKEAFKWNVGRSAYGNGSGVLANFTAQTGAVKTAGIVVDSLKNLKVGLTVDVYVNNAIPNGGAKLRITSIDRANNKIYLDGELTLTSATGYVTVQGSKGLELTGIESYFDSNVTTVNGLAKSENMWMTPVTKTVTAADFSDLTFTDVFNEAYDNVGAEIDMFMVGNNLYKKLLEVLRETNYTVVNGKEYKGGYKGIQILAGGKVCEVVNDRRVADNVAYGVDISDWEFHVTPTNFVAVDDASAFQRKDNTSNFQAVIGAYGDIICHRPAGIAKITYTE